MITPAQRTAIFQAARTRGFSVDEVRDMTPRKSISALTVAQASALLNRLNEGTAYARERSPARETVRAPARAKGTFAPIQPAQKILIESIAAEIGWDMPRLWAFLATKHYARDPSRNMKQIDSSADAVSVIEFLKAVREKHFAARARELASGQAPLPEQTAAILARKMKICELLHWDAEQLNAWLRKEKFPNGRERSNVASSADASLLIEVLTRKLKSLGEIPADQSRARQQAVGGA